MMRLLALMLVGCSGTSLSDATDVGPSGDTGPDPTSTERWSFAPLDEADGGLQLRLVADGADGAWAAWFANTPTVDGICDEIEIAPPPRERFDLRIARVTETGADSAELLASPVASVQPTGLDLAMDAAGRPAVAYTGGDPEGRYCGAHDAVVARTDGAEWTHSTAASESNDAAAGEAASDAGFVVGQWPALAFDANGDPSVLYRDVHFGSLQRDDQFRADAELAQQAGGGGWSHEGVDQGDGGGLNGKLAFDAQGRAVAAYVIPIERAQSRLGVWVARQVGGTWERVRLFDGDVSDQISLVVGDEIAVAFNDVGASSARVRILPADGTFSDPDAWSNERVGRGPFDEGRHVSMARDPSGNPVLAYHACKRLTDAGTSCNINDEALVVATRDGSDWSYDVVRRAEGASCGRYTSIAFDASGRAWVGFRCSVAVGDDFEQWPFVAWRDW